MDNKKWFQIRIFSRDHYFLPVSAERLFPDFESAERHARATARHDTPVEIWGGGEAIARVSADKLKRTRMRMLAGSA